MKLLCLAAFLFSGLASGKSRFKLNDRCVQPRGDFCVEIRRCPYFADLLDRSVIPRPKHVIDTIRTFQCGFKDNTPLVCCQKEQATSLQAAKPPDTSKHRNRVLVPQDDCGPIANEFRITGGREAGLYEFPWMALLAYKTDKSGHEFRCDGSLINDRYVLTAAHCIYNMTLAGVRLGEHNINTRVDCSSVTGKCAPPVQDFYIEDVTLHPDYVPASFGNDIALIRLATPVKFANNVQPICLPFGSLSEMSLVGKFAMVAGWGVTETGFKSPQLLKTLLPVVSNDECDRIYRKYANVTMKQLCAGGAMGRDTCGGDSGGPLYHVSLVEGGEPRYVQHGVVSYGPRHCGTDGQPAVYTRISYYMDWILDNLKPSSDEDDDNVNNKHRHHQKLQQH
ncbi:PREDICTED: venom protease-like [Nicrophorus vespilloides]|uniref:CLIP domain-containing serine protease n=1 Tax=Nicrophorus vespilloides TaxID=110193 RepID=A0ABM1MGG9_NICVS|nr:PREDICTED: venom protease-like [Nicrophorus vespilloides]